MRGGGERGGERGGGRGGGGRRGRRRGRGGYILFCFIGFRGIWWRICIIL